MLGGVDSWCMNANLIFSLSIFWLQFSSFEPSLLHSRRPSASSLLKSCDRPCFNGGSCIEGSCVCEPGWTGPQCDSCFNRILKTGNSSGHITDGPLNYSASSRCTWIITSDTNNSLVLKLEEFFTECCWDHLYVYDGRSVGDNLIAAFSGNLTGSEVIAKSGTAIVYFTSDLAFNLRGFNVSYTYGQCLYNCSNGNGKCVDGKCVCNEGYAGDYCETRYCIDGKIGDPCPADRECINDKCKCSSNEHGDLCKKLTTEPVWDRVPIKEDNLRLFNPRASHQAVNVDGKVWIYGGYQLNHRENPSDLLRYDLKERRFEEVEIKSKEKPESRYDHSMVYYQEALYVFGGVVNQSIITNELWRFDLKTLKWSLESAFNGSYSAIPSAVSGHTAHVIKDEMFVIFGYNPFEGYIHRVQIYSFATKTWANPDERGGTDPKIMGRFGHSSVLTVHEEKRPLIFVYGGFNAPLNSYSYAISDELLMYDPSEDTWKSLESPGISRFRHSSVVIDNIMLIFGGNSHNESTTQQAGCYSSLLMAYDTVCKNWMKIQVEDIFQLSRYGHAAVTGIDDKTNLTKMFIFGGFSGAARHDVIKLTPTSECDSHVYSPKECTDDANGIRCALVGKKCQPVLANQSYRQPFSEFIKSDSPKLQSGCYNTADNRLVEESSCTDIKDCFECVGRKRCGWCSTTHSCMGAGAGCLDDLTSDRRSCNGLVKKQEKMVEERACGLATNCYACRRMSHCVWLTIETKRVCVSKSDQALILEQHNRRQAAERLHYDDLPSNQQSQLSLLSSSKLSPTGSSATNSNLWTPYHHRDFNSGFGSLSISNSTMEQCPDACATYNKCFDCVRVQCMWCPTIQRCVPMDTYMISFPYGQCQTWITAANSPHSCEADPLDCRLQKTCTECQLVGPKCGWCDKGEGTGLGECMDATIDGPLDTSQCLAQKNETWYYTGEPLCQCNGHSTCLSELQPINQNSEYPTQKCQNCTNMTRGDHCELCVQGFYGDSRNGGSCKACECNNQAVSCDPDTGYCFCNIKGTAGRHCDHCELKYAGDPREGKPCTFELLIDFIFTFKLDADDFKDKHVRQINFFSMPFKRETDVQFSVTCESETGAKVSINLTSNIFDPHPGPHNGRLSPALACTSTGVKRVYSSSDFDFGSGSNTTFYVKITDFETPIKIQISFSQSPPVNWILFFVIFAACFIVLLVVAGILLLIKQRIRNAGNEANVIIENERMAARPKAIVQLDLPLIKQNTQPTAVSVEPCRNFTTAIYTVVVRLPTGKKNFTPFGTSGLAFGSTLCNLSQAQIALLEPPNPNEKTDNRKSSLRRFIPFMR